MLTHSQAFSDQFLTTKQVKERASSAFTKIPSNRTSHRYVHISTELVLDDLVEDNWHPVDAYQVRPKKKENKGYQKHFIRFRNPNIFIGNKDDIKVIPELLAVNSYDARSSFKLYMALYRHDCANLLCVKSEELDSMNISHKGWDHEEFPRVKALIVKNTERAIALMHKLSKIQLTFLQQKMFAQECCRARWDYTYKLHDTKSLLQPVRPEDEPNDLFTIYNRVQEKLLKGGWIGAGGRLIKPLKDPNRELKVNAKLFEIVENFCTQIIKQKI